jgi:hypothetical protein
MSDIFGNTMIHLRRVAIIGIVFASVVCVLLGLDFYIHHRLATDWPAAVIGALCIGGVLPLIVLPTCLFSIRVDEQYISHLFCGRIVLKQCPVSQLESVRVGFGFFAVVFRFADGSRIHFLGAHIRVIQALCVCIHERLPHFRGFHFGGRYVILSKMIHELNSNA